MSNRRIPIHKVDEIAKRLAAALGAAVTVELEGVYHLVIARGQDSTLCGVKLSERVTLVDLKGNEWAKHPNTCKICIERVDSLIDKSAEISGVGV
jgi:hypothetical protein